MSSIPSQGHSEHARKEDLEIEDFKQDFAFDELNKIDWLAHIGLLWHHGAVRDYFGHLVRRLLNGLRG